MNPGPAISSAAISRCASTARTSATMAWARSRGGFAAAFASTIAAFTAKSPCFGSRGASTENAASRAGQRPSAAPFASACRNSSMTRSLTMARCLYRARAAGASGQSRAGRAITLGARARAGISGVRVERAAAPAAPRARGRVGAAARAAGRAAAAEQGGDEEVVARRELARARRVGLTQELAHLPGHLAAPVELESAPERRERVGRPAEPVERAPVEEVQRRVARGAARDAPR